MRVRVGSQYIYHANLLDRVDARTDFRDGETVRVINMPGCPKANTMGHCYVERVNHGAAPSGYPRAFGLVHCNSLHTIPDYIEYLKRTLAVRDAENND